MGGKRGKHTSISKDLKQSIEWLDRSDYVTKIVLGQAESCRHRYPPGHLKVLRDEDGGLSVKGYSGNGVINLFIRVNPIENRAKVKQAIADKF